MYLEFLSVLLLGKETVRECFRSYVHIKIKINDPFLVNLILANIPTGSTVWYCTGPAIWQNKVAKLAPVYCGKLQPLLLLRQKNPSTQQVGQWSVRFTCTGCISSGVQHWSIRFDNDVAHLLHHFICFLISAAQCSPSCTNEWARAAVVQAQCVADASCTMSFLLQWRVQR